MGFVREIPPQEIGGVWPTIRPLVEKALKRGGGAYSAPDIRADLIAGRKHLLFCSRPVCIFITEVIIQPDGQKICNIFMVSGTFPNEWRGILQMTIEGAARLGCNAIEYETERKALSRLLPDWRPVKVRYRKDLRHG